MFIDATGGHLFDQRDGRLMSHGQSLPQIRLGDELNVFFDEVQAGFEFRQQIEKLIPQVIERP